ncbi:hypothetical protein [Tellurirhabdus bombi]|uniref:hypothetical protein n=1 Tax=Tellurirhabdus bombi TaxID=2907205 RepID=UPI001F48DBAB|nr:hypothetical protein [Tellurirhabdus bombi]
MQPTQEQQKLSTDDAAMQIFDQLTSEGFSVEEKIAIRKSFDVLIRTDIDQQVQKLQNLRAAI